MLQFYQISVSPNCSTASARLVLDYYFKKFLEIIYESFRTRTIEFVKIKIRLFSKVLFNSALSISWVYWEPSAMCICISAFVFFQSAAFHFILHHSRKELFECSFILVLCIYPALRIGNVKQTDFVYIFLIFTNATLQTQATL